MLPMLGLSMKQWMLLHLACMTTMTSLSTPWTSALSSGRWRTMISGMHRSLLLMCGLCSPTAISAVPQITRLWQWQESYRMVLSSVIPRCQMNHWNQGLYQSLLSCPLAWPNHFQSPPVRKAAVRAPLRKRMRKMRKKKRVKAQTQRKKGFNA
uniref:Mitochondrial mRNA-processing protein COX24 C-terminal domain-containing protein n=1 Tax=Theropithecus gelada TaxID=9565 RepID=A0A8D2G288_THEGE